MNDKSGISDQVHRFELRRFTPRGAAVPIRGGATSVNGLISTARALFDPDGVDDVLFDITYGGQTPAWPT